MRDPVEAYFADLRDIYNSGAGVAETSYYTPLATFLSGLGHKLKPKVSAIINLRNTGAGIPDGGLFTANQLKAWTAGEDVMLGQLPNRGAIEVKGTSDDAFVVAESEQVARYVERYGLVLVTNLRQFVLVGRAADKVGTRILESCSLAESESVFWARVQQPQTFTADVGESLTEFLRRVLLHNAPLSDPKDVAWFLASYARTARLRLESRSELPALGALRSQLEESLGLKFEGDKGDHFFRSTLVQTLFYGMFASWVLWARDKDRADVIDWRDRFQWETASQTLHVPMVAELFYQFSHPGRLRDLEIAEILEWAEEVLWRVDRVSFFERFQEEHAVQYFYEPFLEAFDPQLRKELGVWYTPDEVVKYMVARVDWALREELGIADGLADPSVVVLDPCCGTGAFLVEVLRKIDETLTAKGADALTRNDVKRAAMERIIGFEIMPAPYVIAHLQMGILLAEFGVPLKDERERAAVYLTNALTGWGDGQPVPPKTKGKVHPNQMYATALFPEFAEERDAANRVKREEQVLVVIGNPPYNIYAGMAVDEERELSEAYRSTKVAPKPQGRGLNDLFVRFLRLAERQITERTKRGVVCLISNNAWLDGLSYTGMRERYLEVFDGIWIDNLHGDKYRTGKTTPDGRPDPSVFSTEKNREGIQVGTAIATLVKSRGCVSSPVPAPQVRYRDFRGLGKRERLLTSSNRGYRPLSPVLQLGLPLLPSAVEREYLGWPRLPELLPFYTAGVITSRDRALVDTDRAQLEQRLRPYFDSREDVTALIARLPELFREDEWFDPATVRARLVAEGYKSERVVPYEYRPFDTRWLYWETEAGLVRRPRPELIAAIGSMPTFLVSQQKGRKRWSPPFACRALPCYDLIDRGVSAFPTSSARSDEQALFEASRRENLTDSATSYLRELGGEVEATRLVDHILAVGHSPAYSAANADALMQDWMRVPLPASGEVLERSGALGAAVRGHLLGVSSGKNQLPLAVLSSRADNVLDPSRDLRVTARWGVAGAGGVTMPSTGTVTKREYSTTEHAAIASHAASIGVTAEQVMELLGTSCLDVYLNDSAYWRCVPANVWHYTIGGYQVIKKWLSYREKALLGRDLKPEEARYVTEMVRRIAALILMQPELDANYERVKTDTWEWSS